MADHYAALGVSPDAAEEVIKAAYRKLVLELHPDKHNGVSQPRFLEVQKAWEALRNSGSRHEYDEQRRQAAQRAELVVSAEVDVDDMEFNDEDEAYTYRCRCGGLFVLPAADLDDGHDVVTCESCSLKLRVLDADV